MGELLIEARGEQQEKAQASIAEESYDCASLIGEKRGADLRTSTGGSP